MSSKSKLTVCPEIKDIDEIFPVSGIGEDVFSMKPGRGDELLMIRDFRYGDDVKRISYKASARTGRVMVREYSKEEPGRVSVVLDDLGPHDEKTFEKAVSLAASFAKKFIDEGMAVRLITSRYALPYGGGIEHLFRMLDLLAVIKENGEFGPPEIEEEGNVLILKSEMSSLKGLVPYSDTVVYASHI